jgi:hypothetical protein
VVTNNRDVKFGLVFATKGFPKYNDHMNGALSSRAATGQLRHVKHDVKVPIDHFESQMGHVSQSQVVTGMFFAMEPDIVERRFGSAGGVLGSPSARKPAPVLFSETNQTVKQARQAPGRGLLQSVRPSEQRSVSPLQHRREFQHSAWRSDEVYGHRDMQSSSQTTQRI